MKFLKLTIIIGFSLLFYVACSSTAAPTGTEQKSNQSNVVNVSQDAVTANEDLIAAKALYQKQKCSRCHQENGEGGKNVQIGDLTLDEVPSFKDSRVAAAPDEEYIKKILNGGDGMPKYKDKLSKDEVNLLVRYIRSEFQGN